MTNLAEAAPAATALVLSDEPVAIRLLVESLKPFAIRLRICADAFAAIGLLNKQKFEAVIADLELGEEATLVMRQLRLSPANRTAVSFVITPEAGHLRASARLESTFVLERPLSAVSISSTFRAAYGLVVRERRRYFRCPVEVTAFVRARQPEELLCLTINISEGGLAVSAPSVPDQGFASVRFTLPGRAGQLFAQTEVCWRGENGQVGVEFVSLPQKSDLQEWLARKLDESLPESVAQLFRGAGN